MVTQLWANPQNDIYSQLAIIQIITKIIYSYAREV